jgi:hypothetical protein
MSLFRQLTRAYVIGRLARGGRARRYSGRGWHARPYSRRPRGRGGFFGPLPYYSRRTRGGSRVTVSGCCLPIPLGIVAALGIGARQLGRR